MVETYMNGYMWRFIMLRMYFYDFISYHYLLVEEIDLSLSWNIYYICKVIKFLMWLRAQYFEYYVLRNSIFCVLWFYPPSYVVYTIVYD